MGWSPIRILDNFKFSPIFELSVQMAYPMKTLEEDICFVQNGLIPNSGLGQIQIQSEFWIISPNGLSNENSRRR